MLLFSQVSRADEISVMVIESEGPNWGSGYDSTSSSGQSLWRVSSSVHLIHNIDTLLRRHKAPSGIDHNIRRTHEATQVIPIAFVLLDMNQS